MRKLLLLVLSLTFLSQMGFAQEAAQQNTSDEDSFQQVSAPAPETAPADVGTIEVPNEPQAQAEVVAPAPAPVVAPAPKVASAPAPQAQPDPIDVSAVYRTKPAPQAVRRPMTEAEKMKLMRARLEKQNEILVKKQIERMRLKQEMEMSKRIQKTFDDSIKKLEAID